MPCEAEPTLTLVAMVVFFAISFFVSTHDTWLRATEYERRAKDRGQKRHYKGLMILMGIAFFLLNAFVFSVDKVFPGLPITQFRLNIMSAFSVIAWPAVVTNLMSRTMEQDHISHDREDCDQETRGAVSRASRQIKIEAMITGTIDQLKEMERLYRKRSPVTAQSLRKARKRMERAPTVVSP